MKYNWFILFHFSLSLFYHTWQGPADGINETASKSITKLVLPRQPVPVQGIRGRVSLVNQEALDKLGLEFQLLHDRYLAIPPSKRGAFRLSIGPGALRDESFQITVDFKDLRDFMTFNDIDVSIIQVWTMWVFIIINGSTIFTINSFISFWHWLFLGIPRN